MGTVFTAWPFISQMNPDASTIAAGAPIEVDLAPIAEGQDIKVFWRGKPIYISHRTKKQIDEARAVPVASLPDPETDQGQHRFAYALLPHAGDLREAGVVAEAEAFNLPLTGVRARPGPAQNLFIQEPQAEPGFVPG